MNSGDPTVTSSGPRDVFLHLLAVLTLYLSAVSLGALLFGYIDYAFPDLLGASQRSTAAALRWPLASLVIIFPVYVWASWFLQKDATLHSEKRELRARKWLLYLTLFLAAVVIIGDLVTLVYNFLGGELSPRFILKIAAVFVIAGAVFTYYLWNLRSERMASRDPLMRFFVWGMVLAVAAAVISGFFLVGSPFAERLRRFDERKTSDLQSIQWQVVSYWQQKEKLPQSLDDLRDDVSGFIPPRDPESGDQYEYRATGPRTFELCALFRAESVADASVAQPAESYRVRPAAQPAESFGVKPTFFGEDVWAHGAGRACFTRTIDPDRYPPFKKDARPAAPFG